MYGRPGTTSSRVPRTRPARPISGAASGALRGAQSHPAFREPRSDCPGRCSPRSNRDPFPRGGTKRCARECSISSWTSPRQCASEAPPGAWPCLAYRTLSGVVSRIELIDLCETELIAHERDASVERAPHSYVPGALRGKRSLRGAELQKHGPATRLADDGSTLDRASVDKLFCSRSVDDFAWHEAASGVQ
jgi:hypothetical protein